MSTRISERKTKPISKSDQNKSIFKSDRKNQKGELFKTREQIQIQEDSEHVEGQSLKLVSRKQTNYFQRVNQLIEMDSTRSFSNQPRLNKLTSLDQQSNQSILKLIFRANSINKVEIHENYLSLHLQPNKAPSYISSLPENFNSLVDNCGQSLAFNLTAINHMLQDFHFTQNMQNPQLNAENITLKERQIGLLIDSLKDKPFFIRILPHQFIISQSFLKLVGRDMEEFAQQCIQYRVILNDYFTSTSHPFLLTKSSQMLELFYKVVKGEINMQELIKTSNIEYIDTLIGNNEQRITARIKTFMPNAYSIVMLIDQVLEEQDMQVIGQNGCDLQQKYKKQYLQQKVCSNIKTLKQLIPQQLKYLGRPAQKICKYKAVRVKHKKQDADYQL